MGLFDVYLGNFHFHLRNRVRSRIAAPSKSSEQLKEEEETLGLLRSVVTLEGGRLPSLELDSDLGEEDEEDGGRMAWREMASDMALLLHPLPSLRGRPSLHERIPPNPNGALRFQPMLRPLPFSLLSSSFSS